MTESPEFLTKDALIEVQRKYIELLEEANEDQGKMLRYFEEEEKDNRIRLLEENIKTKVKLVKCLEKENRELKQ